jgi:hypothetical protein
LGFDQLDQRAGDGAVADVGGIGPRDKQQDVDAVLGQRAKRWRIGNVVKAAFDAVVLRQVSGLRVVQGFPGPGEDVRIVAANLQNVRGGQPDGCVAAVEKGVEGCGAPGFEGVEDAVGAGGFGREGIVEEVLQIPAELAHEVGSGLGFYGEIVGGGDGYGGGGLGFGVAS